MNTEGFWGDVMPDEAWGAVLQLSAMGLVLAVCAFGVAIIAVVVWERVANLRKYPSTRRRREPRKRAGVGHPGSNRPRRRARRNRGPTDFDSGSAWPVDVHELRDAGAEPLASRARPDSMQVRRCVVDVDVQVPATRHAAGRVRLGLAGSVIDPLATRSLTVDQDGQRVDPSRHALDIADDLIAKGRREEATELVEEWIVPVLEKRAGKRRA